MQCQTWRERPSRRGSPGQSDHNPSTGLFFIWNFTALQISSVVCRRSFPMTIQIQAPRYGSFDKSSLLIYRDVEVWVRRRNWCSRTNHKCFACAGVYWMRAVLIQKKNRKYNNTYQDIFQYFKILCNIWFLSVTWSWVEQSCEWTLPIWIRERCGQWSGLAVLSANISNYYK